MGRGVTAGRKSYVGWWRACVALVAMGAWRACCCPVRVVKQHGLCCRAGQGWSRRHCVDCALAVASHPTPSSLQSWRCCREECLVDTGLKLCPGVVSNAGNLCRLGGLIICIPLAHAVLGSPSPLLSRRVCRASAGLLRRLPHPWARSCNM